MSEFAISLADVRQAAERIDGHVLRTPSLHNERLSTALACNVFFKAENLQPIGAFKVRGACNAVLQLPADIAHHGVVTHSSGNHAAALARAATRRKISAYVVMPVNSAKSKVAAVRGFGVEPIFCEPTAQSRADTAQRLADETGASLVHPYDDPHVMAGQGTVGLEILQQVADVDVILAPVGGGGLLSGIITAIKESHPDIEVIAVEPTWADDAYRSWKSGSIQPPSRVDTIADGLRSPLGTRPFPIIHQCVDDILLVSESQIREAMRTLAERAYLVVEPSGAVALAGLIANHSRFAGKTVAVVLSGGNVDFGNCQLGR